MTFNDLVGALTSLFHGANSQPQQPQQTFDQFQASKGFFKGPDGVYRQVGQSPAPTAAPSVMGATTPVPSPSPSSTSFSPDAIKAGILNWSGGKTNVPVLNNVNDLYAAGQQFQKAGLDPYMPTILTLRETQGGRDNTQNPTIYGDNNYTNIRNIRDSKTGAIIGQPNNPKSFINYSSMADALGTTNNGHGLAHQILNSGLYDNYLKSKNLQDFFKVYSNPSDKNGSLPDQEANYNYMRQKF